MVANRVDGDAGDAGPPTTTFEARSKIAVDCLTWTTDGLYACGLTNTGAPWVIAKSTDEGRTYTPMLTSLLDILGPRDCPADSPSATQCVAGWPTQRGIFETLLGLRNDMDASAEAGVPDAAAAAPARKPDDGCGCQIPTGGATGGALVVGLSALVGLVRRGRRSRR
jgi:hypothetical protein